MDRMFGGGIGAIEKKRSDPIRFLRSQLRAKYRPPNPIATHSIDTFGCEQDDDDGDVVGDDLDADARISSVVQRAGEQQVN